MQQEQKDNLPHSRAQSKFLGLLVAGIILTVSTGTLYGYLIQRWGPPVDLVSAAAHLETMPEKIGDWQMTEKVPMGESTVEMLQCAGYANRRYVNQANGDSIAIVILVGPTGPIAVHTPEVCYSSRNYDKQEDRTKSDFKGVDREPHGLWNVTFRSNRLVSQQLCVYYGWTTDGNWKASRKPRYEFASNRMLYKLQIAGNLAANSSADGRDPCREFLEELFKSNWSVGT